MNENKAVIIRVSSVILLILYLIIRVAQLYNRYSKLFGDYTVTASSGSSSSSSGSFAAFLLPFCLISGGIIIIAIGLLIDVHGFILTGAIWMMITSLLSFIVIFLNSTSTNNLSFILGIQSGSILLSMFTAVEWMLFFIVTIKKTAGRSLGYCIAAIGILHLIMGFIAGSYMHGICALVITSGLFMACRTFIRFGRFTGYVPFESSETGSNISGKTDDSVICPVFGNRVKKAAYCSKCGAKLI